MTTPGSDAGTSSQAHSAAEAAREQAGQVGQTAAAAGRDVASTARDEAGAVVQEARTQARSLAVEARDQVSQQADEQRRRLTDNLYSLSDELKAMVDKGGQEGLASQVAQFAAEKTHDVAVYVEEHRPGDIVDEVRDFARRRPGTFLLGSLVAGVAAGRLTRGAASAAKQQGASAQSTPVPRQSTTTVRTGLDTGVPVEATPAHETGPAPEGVPVTPGTSAGRAPAPVPPTGTARIAEQPGGPVVTPTPDRPGSRQYEQGSGADGPTAGGVRA